MSVSQHARCLVEDQVHFNVENKLCSAIIFNYNQTVVTSNNKKQIKWKKKLLVSVDIVFNFDFLPNYHDLGC